MLAATVRQGDQRFPLVIFDDFSRPNSTVLGKTPTGYVEWEEVRGNWSVSDHNLHVPTSTSNPLVVVNARRSDVDIEVELTSRSKSGDGIAFRVADASNYFRLAVYYATSTSANTVTEESWGYFTSPVSFDGGATYHSHDYKTWEVAGTGPNEFRDPLHNHGSFGNHADYLAVKGTETREVVTSYTTTVTRELVLERIESGGTTQLGSWDVPSLHKIGVATAGDQITVFRRDSGGAVTNVASVTSTFNQSAVKHGVARRGGGTQGTGVNTFSLVAS